MLHLHIGRGKVGSSTIQRLATNNIPEFEAQGMYCPPSGNTRGNATPLARSLGSGDVDKAPLEALARALNEHENVFVSSEFLFSVNRPAHLREALGDHPINIIAYIRDYVAWIPSVYAQRVKKGNFGGDFDAFYAQYRKGASCVPQLQRWAAAFGWENVRIRALDRRDLIDGDLAVDLWKAVGMQGDPPPQPNTNISPHWTVLELMRAVQAALPEGHRLKALVRRRVEAMLEPLTLPARYLSQAQAEDLAAQYAADLKILEEKTGHAFPPGSKPEGERPFLPTLAALPAPALIGIRDRIRKSKLKPWMREMIREVVEAALSEAEATEKAA